MNTPISISYTSDKSKEPAKNFADKHKLALNPISENKTSLILNYTEEFVELRDTEKNIAIHIDFLSGDLAHRQQFGGGRGQSIAKAIGLKQGVTAPSVLDATAGLAKDAFVLACLGCPLTLLERSPIVTELIRDAVKRAEDDEHFQSIIKTGFDVKEENSIKYLTQLSSNENATLPDVIYLDPMYPERKKSASVKKNMQLLQSLLGKDEDTQALLDIAIKVARKRVVVKRPKGAENLSALNPTYHVASKKTRYDIYIIPQ
ncbi:MAG: class I SAM-dependent methyltransferase [Gammaproteobacteria bacterium]|nr:class I SAM-dependent methyltransferase [Gammaproteobacteria bacterium]